MPLHRVFVINSHCSRIQKSEFGSDNRARMFLGFYIRPLRWIQSPSRYVIFIVTSFGLQEFSSNEERWFCRGEGDSGGSSEERVERRRTHESEFSATMKNEMQCELIYASVLLISIVSVNFFYANLLCLQHREEPLCCCIVTFYFTAICCVFLLASVSISFCLRLVMLYSTCILMPFPVVFRNFPNSCAFIPILFGYVVRRRGADGRIPVRTLDRGASSSAAEPAGHPGGPYDSSLLVKYEHHVARHLLFGEERGPKKESKVAGHGLKLTSRVPLVLPPQMESWV
ncbi:hypothetical protein KIW84_011764 [Lathyrus oleraceus]|uniref:Uncharacterized protein n=1 Tax=Pisum sativum TaxID=3888 RepID=A0A9D5BFS0_PEA|nr:hypothetical protein KIW84_011764 [Pisum sativum]